MRQTPKVLLLATMAAATCWGSVSEAAFFWIAASAQAPLRADRVR